MHSIYNDVIIIDKMDIIEVFVEEFFGGRHFGLVTDINGVNGQ